MDNFKSPLSFSTDDIYLQAKTDIEKNVVINIDDSDSLNPTVNILLNIPVKDINKILYDKDRCVDYDGWNIPDVRCWIPCPQIEKD